MRFSVQLPVPHDLFCTNLCVFCIQHLAKLEVLCICFGEPLSRTASTSSVNIHIDWNGILSALLPDRSQTEVKLHLV